MRNLNYELEQLCRRNRDGSFVTRRNHDLVANQLHELGYRHMATASLKPKHVERLVERWQTTTHRARQIRSWRSVVLWL